MRSAVPSNGESSQFRSCCYDGAVMITKRGSMTSKSWISRLGALLVAFVLTVAPSVSPGHAVEDARKVIVVSFGLFGDQGVFRSEAAGAAQVVESRFGRGPINVQYNSKKGGGATIQALAMALQAADNGVDAENDVLFVILTSHGSRAGLAVKAGRLTQTLTPSDLAGMLARTGVRHKVVVISACYSGVFIPRLTAILPSPLGGDPTRGLRAMAASTWRTPAPSSTRSTVRRRSTAAVVIGL